MSVGDRRFGEAVREWLFLGDGGIGDCVDSPDSCASSGSGSSGSASSSSECCKIIPQSSAFHCGGFKSFSTCCRDCISVLCATLLCGAGCGLCDIGNLGTFLGGASMSCGLGHKDRPGDFPSCVP